MKRPRRLLWPMRTTLPSLTAMTGAPRRAKILIPLRRLEPSTTSARLPRLRERLLSRFASAVVRVVWGGVLFPPRWGGLRGEGKVALVQAGERADEVGGQAADQTRAHDDGVDVPVRVVVGEDRLAQVLLGAGGLEVAGGREDRVDRAVGVLEAVL